MNQEKLKEAYEKLLKKCPDILTPMKAARWQSARLWDKRKQPQS